MQKLLFCLLILLQTGLLSEMVSAQNKNEKKNWDDWSFIFGEWTGVESPAKASGKCTFQADLDKNIIVRKNHTDIPSSDGRPAISHDDLMIIYRSQSDSVKAIYFDNEGHVINYSVSMSANKQKITFLSDVSAGVPRFRLTYEKMDENKLMTRFEFAAPGTPEQFRTYLEAPIKKTL